MSATFRTSREYKKKKARIQKVPEIGLLSIAGLRKKDAADFIRIFHDGIKGDTLGLIRLAQSTISSKKSQGLPKPKTPLYGAGDKEKPKSFSSMLRIRKLKRGWKVYPSWGRHHKANLQLRALLKIHETGAIIKRGDTMTRIPPRPAFMLSKERFLKKVSKRNDSRKFKKEIANYINNGRSEWFDEMIKIYYSSYNDLLE